MRITLSLPTTLVCKLREKHLDLNWSQIATNALEKAIEETVGLTVEERLYRLEEIAGIVNPKESQ